jgi:hypothetical protein
MRTTRPFKDGLFFVLWLAVLGGLALECGDAAPSARERAARPTRPVAQRTIQQGMTMAEVLEVLGPPDVKVRHEGGERWSYWVRDGRQRLVGKAYVIFDEGNRVSEIVKRPDASPPAPKSEPRSAT